MSLGRGEATIESLGIPRGAEADMDLGLDTTTTPSAKALPPPANPLATTPPATARVPATEAEAATAAIAAAANTEAVEAASTRTWRRRVPGPRRRRVQGPW